MHDCFCCLLFSCSVNLVLLKRADLAALQLLLYTLSAAAPQVVTGPASPHRPHHMRHPDLERPPLEGREVFESIPSLLRLPTKQVCQLWGLGHYTQTVNSVSLTPQSNQPSNQELLQSGSC